MFFQGQQVAKGVKGRLGLGLSRIVFQDDGLGRRGPIRGPGGVDGALQITGRDAPLVNLLPGQMPVRVKGENSLVRSRIVAELRGRLVVPLERENCQVADALPSLITRVRLFTPASEQLIPLLGEAGY